MFLCKYSLKIDHKRTSGDTNTWQQLHAYVYNKRNSVVFDKINKEFLLFKHKLKGKTHASIFWYSLLIDCIIISSYSYSMPLIFQYIILLQLSYIYIYIYIYIYPGQLWVTLLVYNKVSIKHICTSNTKHELNYQNSSSVKQNIINIRYHHNINPFTPTDKIEKQIWQHKMDWERTETD